MAKQSATNLLTRAGTISSETTTAANTATRVGSWMRDVLDSVPTEFDTARAYTAGQWAIWQGRLVRAFSATIAGQSPATNALLWEDMVADSSAKITAGGPDLPVTSRAVFSYIASIISGLSVGGTIPLASDSVAGIVRRASAEVTQGLADDASFITPLKLGQVLALVLQNINPEILLTTPVVGQVLTLSQLPDGSFQVVNSNRDTLETLNARGGLGGSTTTKPITARSFTQTNFSPQYTGAIYLCGFLSNGAMVAVSSGMAMQLLGYTLDSLLLGGPATLPLRFTGPAGFIGFERNFSAPNKIDQDTRWLEVLPDGTNQVSAAVGWTKEQDWSVKILGNKTLTITRDAVRIGNGAKLNAEESLVVGKFLAMSVQSVNISPASPFARVEFDILTQCYHVRICSVNDVVADLLPLIQAALLPAPITNDIWDAVEVCDLSTPSNSFASAPVILPSFAALLAYQTGMSAGSVVEIIVSSDETAGGETNKSLVTKNTIKRYATIDI